MTTTMLTPIFAQLAHGLSAEYGIDEAAILALCQDMMKECTVKVSNDDETPAEAPKVAGQKCSWVMKRGKHDGDRCGRNAVGGEHCKQHALLAEKEKNKPQPEQKPKCTYIFTRGEHPNTQCTNNASAKCTLPIHVVACSSHEKALYQKAVKDQEAAEKNAATVEEPVVVEEAPIEECCFVKAGLQCTKKPITEGFCKKHFEQKSAGVPTYTEAPQEVAVEKKSKRVVAKKK